MARTGGIVKSVRIDQDKNAMVLRVVLESGEGSIPIEMRGNEIRGVLEAGDQVVLKGSGRRDRDGVVRPKEIENKTTNSIVKVKRRGVIAKFFAFVFKFGISVGSGALSALIASGIQPVAFRSHTPPQGIGSLGIVPLIIGVAVGLFVLYFLMRRST